MHFMDLLESRCSDGQWEFKIKLVSPLMILTLKCSREFTLVLTTSNSYSFFFKLHCIVFLFVKEMILKKLVSPELENFVEETILQKQGKQITAGGMWVALLLESPNKLEKRRKNLPPSLCQTGGWDFFLCLIILCGVCHSFVAHFFRSFTNFVQQIPPAFIFPILLLWTITILAMISWSHWHLSVYPPVTTSAFFLFLQMVKRSIVTK